MWRTPLALITWACKAILPRYWPGRRSKRVAACVPGQAGSFRCRVECDIQDEHFRWLFNEVEDFESDLAVKVRRGTLTIESAEHLLVTLRAAELRRKVVGCGR